MDIYTHKHTHQIKPPEQCILQLHEPSQHDLRSVFLFHNITSIQPYRSSIHIHIDLRFSVSFFILETVIKTEIHWHKATNNAIANLMCHGVKIVTVCVRLLLETYRREENKTVLCGGSTGLSDRKWVCLCCTPSVQYTTRMTSWHHYAQFHCGEIFNPTAKNSNPDQSQSIPFTPANTNKPASIWCFMSQHSWGYTWHTQHNSLQIWSRNNFPFKDKMTFTFLQSSETTVCLCCPMHLMHPCISDCIPVRKTSYARFHRARWFVPRQTERVVLAVSLIICDGAHRKSLCLNKGRKLG